MNRETFIKEHSDGSRTRLNLLTHDDADKVCELTCILCQEPHTCTPAYKAHHEAKFAADVKEAAAQGFDISWLSAEECWQCGKCMLAASDMLNAGLKTDCHDHPVLSKEALEARLAELREQGKERERLHKLNNEKETNEEDVPEVGAPDAV